MADRSGAYLFATIFRWLAEGEPSERALEFAKELWQMSFDYDFSFYQLYCDNALIKLGLARKIVDPEHNEEVVQYLAFNLKDWRD